MTFGVSASGRGLARLVIPTNGAPDAPRDTQNVTTDGAVEMLTDWFDPSDQDQELAAELRRQDESCDAVLLGRQTFEEFRGYWPGPSRPTTPPASATSSTG